MSAFRSKWLPDTSVSSVSANQSHESQTKLPSVSFGSEHVTGDGDCQSNSPSRASAQGMAFFDILSLENGASDWDQEDTQDDTTAKTDRSDAEPAHQRITQGECTAKTDKSALAAERLLTRLRIANVAVSTDGVEVRCKAARGPIPNDFAQQIRDLKPQLVDLLLTEQQEIDWRVESLGEDLLGPGGERMAGACSWCGATMPVQPSPKCTRCCLAAAQLVLARLDAGLTGQPSYPISPVSPALPEIERSFCDMSPVGAGRRAA